MQGPLHGIRVVEIGNYLAAPFATAQLADLGADVIKVEHPEQGDFVRASGPYVNGRSSTFARLNRNKRSVALDIKTDEGARALTALLGTADVLVENLRPGVLARLGFGWPRVHELNPRLVYVSASGWGQSGPMAQAPGLDVMAQARSGLMSITGFADSPPAKVGVPVCDMTCALYAALGAVAALQERTVTGLGQRVDVSLFEAGVSLAIWEAGQYYAGEPVHGALGSAHQSMAPYQAVRASDGWVTLGATTPRTWASFCDVTGLHELRDDPRFATVQDRFDNREALIALIETVTSAQPTDHWVKLLSDVGIPCAPIQTYDQVFVDPQLVQSGFVWGADDPVMGHVAQLGSAMHFSRTDTVRHSSGPELGQHTAEVLAELDLSAR